MRLPLFLSKNHLKKYQPYWSLITTTVSVCSVCWVGVEILAHFVTEFEKLSRGNLWMLSVIVGIGLLAGIFRFLRQRAQMLSVSHQLRGTDILYCHRKLGPLPKPRL